MKKKDTCQWKILQNMELKNSFSSLVYLVYSVLVGERLLRQFDRSLPQ